MGLKQPKWLLNPEKRLERKNSFDASLVMGTANFNRHTGRQNTLAPPFGHFLDHDTGLLKGEYLTPRNCPVCASPPGQGLFVKDGFRHVRCPKCDLIYVSLILREDLMLKYWREEEAWTNVLLTGPQVEMDRLKYAYGLEVAQSHFSGKRVLDIGAGTGHFVRLAGEKGFEPTAMELNKESAEKLKEEGIEVIVKSMELADLESGSFDLVTLWEVLEHLTDPKVVLSEARRLLSPDGALLILVPNSASLVTRLLHEKSRTFGGHSHLNHFNPMSLRTLLDDLHFEIVEFETVITELGAINNHLAFEDPYLGEANPFFEFLTPKMIHENLWGSRLLALAKVRNDRDASGKAS
ncbi:MAG: class I SAM-dependent methyltransferase [Deltaproteobacteria bacterium]|jgi:2-polyprenyl-3-methyl-5-hydroxy-6-metoxy-1,4-benzoquinol methylase|nr:class I SAM-dependent methyltransferase [Deltaproteobacteria bacterium]